MNFINSIVNGTISSGTKLDFTPVINAGTTDQMVDWLNTLFLHGTMSSQMKQSILTAMSAVEQHGYEESGEGRDLSGDLVVAVSSAAMRHGEKAVGAHCQRVPIAFRVFGLELCVRDC